MTGIYLNLKLQCENWRSLNSSCFCWTAQPFYKMVIIDNDINRSELPDPG